MVRNKISSVEAWRTGPWATVRTRKIQFVTSAWDILNHINNLPLRLIAFELRDLFNGILQSTLQKSHDRMKSEARAIMSQHGEQAVVSERTRKISSPSIAIFPAFAAEWGVIGKDCQECCCVVLLASGCRYYGSNCTLLSSWGIIGIKCQKSCCITAYFQVTGSPIARFALHNAFSLSSIFTLSFSLGSNICEV